MFLMLHCQTGFQFDDTELVMEKYLQCVIVLWIISCHGDITYGIAAIKCQFCCHVTNTCIWTPCNLPYRGNALTEYNNLIRFSLSKNVLSLIIFGSNFTYFQDKIFICKPFEMCLHLLEFQLEFKKCMTVNFFFTLFVIDFPPVLQCLKTGSRTLCHDRTYPEGYNQS